VGGSRLFFGGLVSIADSKCDQRETPKSDVMIYLCSLSADRSDSSKKGPPESGLKV
jgi:hypothetical protein